MAETYLFGRFRLDGATRQLLRDGEPIILGSKAFDALLALVARHNRVVSKEELIGLVWPDRSVSEDLLPQNILALRRALGDDSGQPSFIATVPRRGYRFIAPVTGTPTAAPVGIPAAERAALASSQWRYLWAPAALALLAAGTWIAGRSVNSREGLSERSLRFTQDAPAGTTLVSGSELSPDGRYLAFVAEDNETGKAQLWVRSLDVEEPRAIPGTDGAAKPFWSPDSRSIGVFANGKLKQVGLSGGAPQTVASVGLSPAGGSWSVDGTVLYAAWKSGLTAVRPSGGSVTVTDLDPTAQEIAHQSPQFLPDGRHFLYYVASANPDKAGTYAGSIGARGKVRLLDTHATYAPTGHLLWVRDSTVFAQPFDPSRLRLTGRAMAVAGSGGAGPVVSAGAGDLIAIDGGAAPGPLRWFDRSGKVLGTVHAPTPLHNLAFSADFRRLMASSVGDAEHRGVWLVDLDRDATTRFAPEGTSPWASPDGAHIVFTSDRAAGVADVYVRSTTGQDDFVLRTPENKIVNDWSPDGRYIVYVSTNPVTKKDLWLLDRDRRPIPFLRTPFNEIQGQVSPDGRWMAYASDESGSWEVYAQSFPTPGRKQTISVGGGAQPRWRRDGRELFYLAADHTLTAVDVTLGETIAVGRPRPLFRAPVSGSLNTYRSHYAVTGDGQRFLVDTMDTRPRRDSIGVLVNWRARLTPER